MPARASLPPPSAASALEGRLADGGVMTRSVLSTRLPRIVVVEDEQIVAEDLRSLLEELGYHCAGVAVDSAEAIAIVARERPDLVLMDIRIQGPRDGIDTAALLWASFRVPVVYLSANTDRVTVERALETVPGGFLPKPYTERALGTTIEVALRQQEARSALARQNCELEHRRTESERQLVALRLLADQLARDAATDALTGLRNRREFDAQLSRELKAGGQLGLIVLDLDRFKMLNDTLGHAAGDSALRAVAAELREELGADPPAFRIGGEELAVIVPAGSIESCVALASRIRLRLEGISVCHGPSRFGVTASFGVAISPLHGTDVRDVLRAADAAMYEAKAKGRNRVVVAR